MMVDAICWRHGVCWTSGLPTSRQFARLSVILRMQGYYGSARMPRHEMSSWSGCVQSWATWTKIPTAATCRASTGSFLSSDPTARGNADIPAAGALAPQPPKQLLRAVSRGSVQGAPRWGYQSILGHTRRHWKGASGRSSTGACMAAPNKRGF